MPLTTQAAQTIKENIQTDLVPPVRGNTTLPTGRVLSEEARILLDKSIVAKKFGTPANEEIHIKHTEYYYRWVANEKVAGGFLYGKRLAEGFVEATLDDAEPLTKMIATADGKIRFGDLILMKLPYEEYAARIKANMIQALQLQNAWGAYNAEGADGDVFSDKKVVRQSISSEPFTRHGIKPFIPSEDDINKRLDAGETKGRK